MCFRLGSVGARRELGSHYAWFKNENNVKRFLISPSVYILFGNQVAVFGDAVQVQSTHPVLSSSGLQEKEREKFAGKAEKRKLESEESEWTCEWIKLIKAQSRVDDKNEEKSFRQTFYMC